MLRSPAKPWVQPVPAAPPPSQAPFYHADLSSGGAVSRIGYFIAVTTVALVFSRLIEFVPDFVASLHPGMLLMGFGALIAVLSGGIVRTTKSRVTTFLLAFTIWAAAGVPFSVWRGGAVRTFVFYWAASLLAYITITALITTLDQCRNAMLALAAAILMVLLLSFFRGSDQDVGQLGRFGFDYGNLSNQNILAMVLLMGLPFCALAMHHWRGVGRLLAAGGVALIAISIVRTGSRSGLLGLIIVVSLIFWHASIAGKLRLFVIGCAVALLAVSVSTESALIRFKTVFFSSERPTSQVEATALDSTVSRAMLLHRSVVQTIEHPLLGVGIGQFMVADSDAATEEHIKPYWRVTHNAYTQLSSETGIPGLLLYSAAIILCFRKLKALRKAITPHPELAHIGVLVYYLRLALAGYAISAFFASTAYECYFPILAALVVALDAAAWRAIEEFRARLQTAAAPPAPAMLRRAAAV